MSPDSQRREPARQEFLPPDEATKRAVVRALLFLGTTSPSSVDTAFSALGGPAVDKYLIETVTDEVSFFAAHRALFLTPRPDAPVLQPKLADKNPYVRWAAVMALAWNGLVPAIHRVSPFTENAVATE